MGNVRIGQNHHFEFRNMVNAITKKPHGAEPSAAVHAAAGDALLSLSADTSSAVTSHSLQHLLLWLHVVIHYVKSTAF